jgi:hypothetical protein
MTVRVALIACSSIMDCKKEDNTMANSIRNNADFRALLTRKGGATGKELQACTGRAYVYSTWSLRCMETEKKALWTIKDGNETRYFLKNRSDEIRVAANAAKKLAAANAA